jgi:hypothetical protein
MGFNFGAFAGGLAKAGVDTYTRLGEEERRDAEALQRKEMHDAWKKEQAQNEAIDAAYAETLGRADTPEAFRTAGGAMGPQLEGAQTALPADAAAAFPKQQMYGRDQAMKDYQNKVMGINARKGAEVLGKMQGLRKGELDIKKGELDVASAERDTKFNEKFDKFNEDTHKMAFDLHHEIDEHVATNGLKGAVDKYAAQYKQATGNTVALVGKEMVIKDKEGKVIGKSSDPVQITNSLSEALEINLMTKRGNDMVKAGMFKNAHELQSYLKDRSTMNTQEATAAAATSNAQANMMSARASVQNAATSAQLAVSHAALYNAQAAMSNAHADLFKQSIKTAENNASAKEAMQPYLDKIAEVSDPLSDEGRKEVEKLTLQAVTAGAKHSSDMVKLLGELKKPDKSQNVDPELKKAAYQDLREAGTDVKAIQAVKAKWPEVFGMSETDKAIKAAMDRRANPQSKPAAPAAALPAASAAPAAPAPNTPAPSTVPAAALPTNAPAVTKSTAYGKTGYQIKGVVGVFSSPEEAQAAWAQKYAPKASAGRFD